MKQPTGKPSTPLPVYPVETWACRCGATMPISQTPTALRKGQYSHAACGGFYRPEPGRTETT